MYTYSPSKETKVPVAASSLFHPAVSITDLRKAYTGTHNNVSTKFITYVSKPGEFILSLLFGVSQVLSLTTSQTIVQVTAERQGHF